MIDKVLCPKCIGAKIIMEPKEIKGFHYIPCKLCEGSGLVTKDLEEDFKLSVNEDNFEDYN